MKIIMRISTAMMATILLIITINVWHQKNRVKRFQIKAIYFWLKRSEGYILLEHKRVLTCRYYFIKNTTTTTKNETKLKNVSAMDNNKWIREF